MQESKNSFLKGKMNKDLDDRLVPNGEYRDAVNINTSRSDNSNVGTGENIRGNSIPYASALNLISDIVGGEIEVIGEFVDNKDDRIFWFVTDFSYTPAALKATSSHTCEVYMYDQKSNYVQKILQGYFLNFSKKHLITGISVIENLLFWVDDFNEPRRINISTALNDIDSYTTDSQISIARTAPFKAPLVLKQDGTRGMEFIDDTATVVRSKYIEEKFVRLSYRFKFFDNEFSTIAPFTQHCFMPMNSPSFTPYNRGGGLIDADIDKKAYSETEMPLMVNSINQVNITIELPSKNVAADYFIKGIEILMKDSESSAVKVISYIDLRTHTSSLLYFTYKANNPYKVLSADQLLRTYDRVPIKAKAQEVIGNRIVYGNFEQNYDLPELKYRVEITDKSEEIWKEYPNHTVKQRRNYQVGVVLKDRFGRETPVILPADTQASTIYVNAEPARNHKLYTAGNLSAEAWVGLCLQMIWQNPIPDACQLITVSEPSTFTLETWSGSFTGPTLDVTETILTIPGDYEGLLPVGSSILGPGGVGFTEVISVAYSSMVGYTVITTATEMDADYATVTGGSLFTYYYLHKKTDTTAPGIWESYKIVVKQKEQEYYNVYHTGGVNYKNKTYVTLVGNNINKVPRDVSSVSKVDGLSSSKIKLFPKTVYVNDATPTVMSTGVKVKQGDFMNSAVSVINIGTATEHGFVRKFIDNQAAVGLIFTGTWSSGGTYVKQDAVAYGGLTYYCIKDHTGITTTPNSDTVNWEPLAEGVNVGAGYGEPYPTFDNNNNWNWIYDIAKDPLMADLYDKSSNYSTTLPELGADPIINMGSISSGSAWFAAPPMLTVFETMPFESDLDIFWETSTSGYVAELNELINESPDYPLNIELIGDLDTFLESLTIGSNIPDLRLSAIASTGSIVGYEVVSARDFAEPIPNDCTNRFETAFDGTYWRIKLKDTFHWKTNNDAATQTFRLTIKATQDDGTGEITSALQEVDIFLSNVAPTIAIPNNSSMTIWNSSVSAEKRIKFANVNTVPYTMTGMIGNNGSAKTSESTQELVYALEVEPNLPGGKNPFSINSTTGVITMDCTHPLTGLLDPNYYWYINNTTGLGSPAAFNLTVTCKDAFGNPLFQDWGGLDSNECEILVRACAKVRVQPVTTAENPNVAGIRTLYYTNCDGVYSSAAYSATVPIDISWGYGTPILYTHQGTGGSTPSTVPPSLVTQIGMW
jgi:hypothetical protein